MPGTEDRMTGIDRHNFQADAKPAAQVDYASIKEADIPWLSELLVLFLRNQVRVAPAMPILAFLLALTTLEWVPVAVSATWLGAALACQGIQVYLGHLYFRKERTHDDARDWIGMLSASELLTGVCWSLPLFLFWPNAGNMQQIYMLASVMAGTWRRSLRYSMRLCSRLAAPT